MIDIEYLKNRRTKLANLIDVPTVLWSGKSPSKNFRANHYPFRASSHFLYFAGLPLENAAIKLDNGNLDLFMDNPHPDSSLWHGEMPRREDIALQIGADNAYPMEVLKEQINEVATIPVQDVFTYTKQREILQRSLSINKELNQVDEQLIKAVISLRLTHDKIGLEEIKKAINVSVEAHKIGINSTKKSKTEAEVRAAMESYIISQNMTCAYNSIVTVNGEVLHNETYNNQLKSGDLLLADVGAETPLGWASDITRTFPINGKFSDTQLAVYEIVLEAERKAIECVMQGNDVLLPQAKSEEVITQGLIDLGILKGSLEENLAGQKFKDFYMHKIGHWLGLDVHDSGPYSSSKEAMKFASGMITTIEPGIYISSESDVDDKWKGIGIRIEDDILVTESGNENLTDATPTDPQDIQSLMS